MRVAVCVKRVPITGGRIVLTDDARSINTQHLGFTISPHEECGVEEAVRLIEANKGIRWGWPRVRQGPVNSSPARMPWGTNAPTLRQPKVPKWDAGQPPAHRPAG